MSVCIYLFLDRIIHWTPQTLFSKPVALPNIKWYIVNDPPPLPLNDMVMRGNVGYTYQKGFFTVEGEPPHVWEERENYIKKIQILGVFNTIANSHRARYTDNALGQPLADALILDEIREFRRTKSIEDCTILTSFMETGEAGLSAEALVAKLWLKFEAYRVVIVYLNRVEDTIRKLMEQEDFDKANQLLNEEMEKMMA